MHHPIAMRAVRILLVLVVAATTMSALAVPPTPAGASTETAGAPPTETETASTEVATEEVSTGAPTEIATEQPPTEIPTDTPMATSTDEEPSSPPGDTATADTSETPEVPRGASVAASASTETPPASPNTDTLTAAVSAPGSVTLAPGQEQSYAFTYAVTTPRTGTTVRAELRFADGSIAMDWRLRAQAGAGAWVRGDAAVEVTEGVTLGPDSSFALSYVVTAPAEPAVEQTVLLFVSSTASADHGNEIGVEASGPLVSLTVVPPPPPVEPNSLTCDVPETTEIAPGEAAELSCVYTVNDPAAVVRVTAAFATIPGDGWTLAIGDGAAGETATWVPGEPLAAGTQVELTVRVAAPADAEAGQQATVSVAGDGIDPVIDWLLTVAGPAEGDDGGFSVMSVDPEGGICRQLSPAGDTLPPGSVARFRCGLSDVSWWDLDIIRISRPSTGWHYGVNSNPDRTASYYTSNPTDLLPNADSEFSLGLGLISFPNYESVGSLTVQYIREDCTLGTNCTEVVLRTATLSITWPAPDGACELVSPPGAVVGLGEYATFKCTHSNLGSGGFQVMSQGSPGQHWQWTISTGPAPIVPYAWSQLSFTSPGTTDAVFIYIRPFPSYPPDSGTVQDFPVVIRQFGSNVDTPETLTVTYNAVRCAPTVNFVGGTSFGASTWDGGRYIPVTAFFGLRFLQGGGPDCGGFTDEWSVQISSDGLTDGGDGSIAASDISYVVSDAPSGMAEVATNQPLAATGAGTTKIADGSSSVSPGATWGVTLRLQPPSDAPPGDYSGTITVTIAGGD